MNFHALLPTVLTALSLLTTSASFAQGLNPPAGLVVGIYPAKQAEKVVLAIEKQTHKLALVQLLGPTGEELYVEQLPRQGAHFHQLFDLHQLKAGTYTIRVRQGKTLINKAILVNPIGVAAASNEQLTLGQE